MNDLIKVVYENDTLTVSARDLHEFLEVGTRFNDWFPRMCEYGFEEGTDYYSILSDRSDGLPGRKRTDAALTIDAAKEICMLQRTERGKQARRYFLQLEKDWNSPEKVMARALLLAQQKMAVVEKTQVEAPKKTYPRMRTIPQAVKEVREIDPGACLSEYMLRKWVKCGLVQTVCTGCFPLVNMDSLKCFLKGGVSSGQR